MSLDTTKKQPTTEISELQEFELEYQIRLRAYENFEPQPPESRTHHSIPRTQSGPFAP